MRAEAAEHAFVRLFVGRIGFALSELVAARRLARPARAYAGEQLVNAPVRGRLTRLLVRDGFVVIERRSPELTREHLVDEEVDHLWLEER